MVLAVIKKLSMLEKGDLLLGPKYANATGSLRTTTKSKKVTTQDLW
ncbi:MAG: hypothetical protein M3Y53_01800 [Thermoproteota archaeon]|nr:hypothetical protein [Thermoproteota archaeon]